MGCTDDDEELGKRKTSTLQLIPAVSGTDVAMVTRAAGDLPNSWKLYEDIYPLSLDRTVAINIFMVENHKAESKDDPASVTGTNNNKFSLKKNGNWDSNVRVVDNQAYYIFGFLCDTYSSATLSLLSGKTSYTDGGVIELKGLGAATAADVSLVVGTRKPAEGEDMTDADEVKEIIENPDAATTENPKGKDALGNFDYLAATNNNYIYLWLDHLYSCVNFEFEVEDKYSLLREIKMKKVTLTVNGNTFNVTAEVRKDKYPSLLNIKEVEPDASIAVKDFKVTVFDNEGTRIPAHSEIGTEDASGNKIKALSVPGYFAPGSMKEFTAKFEFDVISKGYDYTTDKPIITRKSATATNKVPASVFGYDDETTTPKKVRTLKPGLAYTIKATIAPTYLYQLAEDDLDNPTIHITTTP